MKKLIVYILILFMCILFNACWSSRYNKYPDSTAEFEKIEQSISDFKDTFSENYIEIIDDTDEHKCIRWTFHLNNDSFDADIIYQCNKVKNEVQTYMQNNPECVFAKDNYQVILLFEGSDLLDFFEITNYDPIKKQIEEYFNCILLKNDTTSLYFKHIDNITVIDGLPDKENLPFIKQLEHLQNVHIRSVSNENYLYYKEQLPGIDIVCDEII